jgi:hypothetical protein
MGALAIPVAIHLLNKTRVRQIRWAATKFLLDSVKKNQRRLQIEDLILLVLRCLIMALLVLAFARPAFEGMGSVSAFGTGGPVVAGFVVDVSASMAQSDGVETRLDVARGKARDVLDGLASGSQASMFLVSDRIVQSIPKPTTNLALVRRGIERATATDAGSDLLPGIQAAIDSVKGFSELPKQIHIFTDSQALAWKQHEQIAKALAQNPGIGVEVHSLGGKGENNVAITGLRQEAMVPAVNQPLGCLVEVTNHGSAPAEQVRVTLAIDQDPPSDETVIDRIEPGATRAVRLFARFRMPGYHTLTASTTPDQLPSDNQRSIAVRVVEQMRVLVVEGTRQARKSDRDAFFLVNALAPVPAARLADYYLKPEAASVAKLDDADLSGYDMIVLSNVGKLGDSASQKLQTYVREGGALVIFPGPNSPPEAYNANPILKDMMPATLGRPAGKEGEFQNWQDKGLNHPVSALWNDRTNGSLATVRASKWFPLAPRAEGAAAAPSGLSGGQGKDAHLIGDTLVIARLANGEPAVMEQRYGKGAVVLFNGPATTQWGNFPIHPAFLPFLSRLTAYLTRQENRNLVLTPGAAFTMPVATEWLGRDFLVLRPDAEGEPRIAGRVELQDQDALIRYRDTDQAGPYRILFKGQDTPVAAFAVQGPPDESNLRVVDETTIKPIVDRGRDKGGNPATPGTATVAAGEEDAPRPLGGDREAWTILVWLAAILSLVEMALAHRFSQTR